MLLFSTSIHSQNWSETAKEKHTSEEKFRVFIEKGVAFYKAGKADSMLVYKNNLVSAMDSQKNDSLKTFAYRIIGNYYYLTNDYVSAITNYNKAVEIAKDRWALKNMLPKLYNNIGFNYYKLKFADISLAKLREAEEASKESDNSSYVYIYENVAETYLSKGDTKNALIYIKKSEALNPIKNGVYADDYIQASVFLDYAMLYDLLHKKYQTPKFKYIAASYYKKAIFFSDNVKPKDFKHLSSAKKEYADFLFRNGNFESAKIYAKESLAIAEQNSYKDVVITTAGLLQQIFESQDSIKIAYDYSKKRLATIDKLAEKNDYNQLMSVTVNSEIERKEAANNREHNLTYLAWAIGIITALVIFFLLSHTIVVDARFITFVGNIGLLIVFEFINMIIHPFVDRFTHSTAIILTFLVLIAIILVRIHRWLENYIRFKLVEKNREIRIRKAELILKKEAQAIADQF